MKQIVFDNFSRQELLEIVLEALEIRFPLQAISNKKDSKDIMNTQETADFLGYKRTTIYRKVSKRELPFFKNENTNRLWFSKEALIDWVKRGKRKTIDEIKQEAEDHLINSKRGGKR